MTQSSTATRTEFDKLFIGGQWVEPSTTEIIEVFSPATGEKVGQVPLAAEADVNAACAAARKAFDEGPWPHMRWHHTRPRRRVRGRRRVTERRFWMRRWWWPPRAGMRRCGCAR